MKTLKKLIESINRLNIETIKYISDKNINLFDNYQEFENLLLILLKFNNISKDNIDNIESTPLDCIFFTDDKIFFAFIYLNKLNLILNKELFDRLTIHKMKKTFSINELNEIIVLYKLIKNAYNDIKN